MITLPSSFQLFILFFFNVSRRFFRDAATAAEITGVEVELIKKFGTILTVLSSGHEVDPEKFDNFAKDTAAYYVQMYKWYRMPPKCAQNINARVTSNLTQYTGSNRCPF